MLVVGAGWFRDFLEAFVRPIGDDVRRLPDFACRASGIEHHLTYADDGPLQTGTAEPIAIVLGNSGRKGIDDNSLISGGSRGARQ